MGVPSFNRKDIKIYICGVLRTGGVTYRRPAMKHPAENRMSNIDKSDLMKKSDITCRSSCKFPFILHVPIKISSDITAGT